MPAGTIPWPHAPEHRLSVRGTYFVTASTYLREHHFASKARLAVLHRGLLKVASEFGWRLEAWAVFSNHYHFIAHSPGTDDTAKILSRMLGFLHEKTAKWINKLDEAKAGSRCACPRSPRCIEQASVPHSESFDPVAPAFSPPRQ